MGYEACGDQIHFPFELKLSPNPISEMQPCSSNSDQDREYDDDDGGYNEYDDDGKDDDDDDEEEDGSDVVADDVDSSTGDDEYIEVDDYFPASGTAVMQELASKEMSLRQRLKF